MTDQQIKLLSIIYKYLGNDPKYEEQRHTLADFIRNKYNPIMVDIHYDDEYCKPKLKVTFGKTGYAILSWEFYLDE